MPPTTRSATSDARKTTSMIPFPQMIEEAVGASNVTPGIAPATTDRVIRSNARLRRLASAVAPSVMDQPAQSTVDATISGGSQGTGASTTTTGLKIIIPGGRHPKRLATAMQSQPSIIPGVAQTKQSKKTKGQYTAPRDTSNSRAVAESEPKGKSDAPSKPRRKIQVAKSDRVTRQQDKQSKAAAPAAALVASEQATPSTPPQNLGAATLPGAMPANTASEGPLVVEGTGVGIPAAIIEQSTAPPRHRARGAFRPSTKFAVTRPTALAATAVDAPDTASASTSATPLTLGNANATSVMATTAAVSGVASAVEVVAGIPQPIVGTSTAHPRHGLRPLLKEAKRFVAAQTAALPAPPMVRRKTKAFKTKRINTKLELPYAELGKRPLSDVSGDMESEMPASQRARMELEGSTSANAQIAPDSLPVQN